MAEKQKIYLNWKPGTDEEGILWCYLDVADKSTNVLSSTVLEELEQIISAVESDLPKGVVIASAKENGFIAGANIDEFITTKDSDEALAYITRIHDLFNRIDSLGCATLSLINGFCLGGGLELALACRYRVALDDPKTRIGLPEVMLGIHPGFGGTMRLIRLIGAVQAIPLMLTGRTLDARKAKKLGVIDKIVPERQMQRAALNLIRKNAPRRTPSTLQRLANHDLVRPLLAKYMRSELRKKANIHHYPAPFAIIDLWEQKGGSEKGMLKAEAESVAKLFITETSRSLVRLFKLQDRLKSKNSDVDFKAKHIHVIGAGVMGGDIAAWCALQGLTVTLQDREPKFIAPAMKRAHKLFKRKLKQTRLVTAAMDRLIPDHKALGVEKADVIIEAIVENAEAKIGLFKELESRAKEGAILATNTSSIPLNEISQHLKNAERLTGIHFFNPVAKMQLVEVIHSAQTGEHWVDKASAFCQQISRLPVPVVSSPGFLVNRILTPYLLEAVALWEEGVPAEQIDKVAKKFGMPMGPVELADTVGLDICLSVSQNMAATLNITIPEKLHQLVDAGHLGKKSGRGFYQYEKGKAKKDKNMTISSLPDIEDRMVMRILNECVACLDEGIVEDKDLLDAGMVFGTGFAPFRGGPMNYALNKGTGDVVQTLNDLESKYGERFCAHKGWQQLDS
ncbi:MAG: crotonase [Gammaproteobacteria bacterium]|nr:crotonase [Gammaproteobacteria bacterium]